MPHGSVSVFTMFLIVMIGSMAAGGCKSDDGGVTPGPTVEPTLSSIQQNVFNVHCNTPSCHGGNAGDLPLTTGNSFANLVNKASIGDGAHTPQFLRVKSGSPDSSFLIIKLTSPSPNQGDLMPKNSGRISDEKISALRTWIATGALNN